MNIEIEELERFFGEYKKSHRKCQMWGWFAVVVACVAITFVGITGVRMYLKGQYWGAAFECLLFWFNLLLLFQNVIRLGNSQSHYQSMKMKHNFVIETLKEREVNDGD